MLRSRLPHFIYVLLILVTIVACRHYPQELAIDPGGGGGTEPCDPNKIYFQQQVLPILISNCTLSGCHDDASHEEGVILTTYLKVMTTGDINPGSPQNSELYEVITDTDPDKRMPPPPRSPLSPDQITIIRQWIQQGALNLSCASICDTAVFTYSGAVKPLMTTKCQGCHSGGAASGGIDLSSFNGVKSVATNGSLWGAINHLSGFTAMPQNGAKLSDCEIEQIRKWIDSGSPNN